jgi:hypothetical protein
MRPAELVQRLPCRLALHAPQAVDTGQFLENLLVVDDGGADNAGGNFCRGSLRIQHLLPSGVCRLRENDKRHHQKREQTGPREEHKPILERKAS